jgi:FK506-binding protein 2
MSKYLIAIVVLMMVIVNTLAEEKLQIGIKKKVDNCEQKSKKGDRLHMHYTVNY